MRKTIIALTILSIMLLSVSMAAVDSDGDGASQYRWTDRTLYHATCVAKTSASTEDTEWVYPIGMDGSMKEYIENPKTAKQPDQGLSHVVAGQTYEVYFFDSSGTFDMTKRDVVLESDPIKLYVEPQSVGKLTVNSFTMFTKTNAVSMPAYLLREMSESWGGSPSLHFIGDVANLNYREGTYYTIDMQGSMTALFYEMDADVVIKTFTGSPYLYIGICIVITALIAVTIAVCGRRPKFD